MALLLAAGILGGGAYYMFDKADRSQKDFEATHAAVARAKPDFGFYSSQAQVTGLAHAGIVTRSHPDMDLSGVPMYYVDYGSGSYTKTYAPPGLLLNAAQNY